jgi:hypothetical protein
VTLDLEPLPPSTYTHALFNGERPMFFEQPGFQVSTRRDLTGINWYAVEAVDSSKVGYRD